MKRDGPPTAPFGHAVWVLLDVDVLVRADPNETAPDLVTSLVDLFSDGAS